MRFWYPLPLLILCAASASAQDFAADIAGLRQSLETEVTVIRRQQTQIRRQQTQLQGDIQTETQDRRRLQGDIEELDFRLKRLETRFDDLISALDRRLQEIEDGLADMHPSESPEPPAAAESTDNPEVSLTETATETGTLGTMTLDAEGAVQEVVAAEATFEDRYSTAIALIGQKSHSEARQQLQSLAKEDPEHALASNILYWLGETYYAEGDYKNAMSQFARSVRQYPEGAKRLDSLLKIGLSLGSTDKIEQACQVLQGMLKDATDVPSDIALRRDNALQRFGCIA